MPSVIRLSASAAPPSYLTYVLETSPPSEWPTRSTWRAGLRPHTVGERVPAPGRDPDVLRAERRELEVPHLIAVGAQSGHQRLVGEAHAEQAVDHDHRIIGRRRGRVRGRVGAASAAFTPLTRTNGDRRSQGRVLVVYMMFPSGRTLWHVSESHGE